MNQHTPVMLRVARQYVASHEIAEDVGEGDEAGDASTEEEDAASEIDVTEEDADCAWLPA